MYVQQGARGAGVGRRLAEAVIEYAQTRVEILQVTVVSSNQPARQLYRKLGFVEYGIEKNALKAGGCYWDDVLMAKPLTPRGPAMIPRYSRPEMAASGSRRTGFGSGSRSRPMPATRWPEWASSQGRAAPSAEHGQVRDRAHRRDRARDPARRHRLPHQPRRAYRPRSALPASGHDLERRARHRARRAADAGRRPPARRSRRAARRAEAPRVRVQEHADHRPQPRHPCRADDLRREARRALRRVRARRAAGRGARGDRDLRDLGRGRHLRQHRSARWRSMSRRSSA